MSGIGSFNQDLPLNKIQQTGFYVVVSDRELLAKMQSLMKRHGYFGYVDTAGKLVYMVDGRQNMYRAAHTIRQLMPNLKEDSSIYEDRSIQSKKRLVHRIIKALLNEYAFSKQHKGTAVLQYLLPIAFENEEKISPLSKFLYPLASRKFEIRPQQVDRVIRYASNASKLRLPNRVLIEQLVEEINSRIYETVQSAEN